VLLQFCASASTVVSSNFYIHKKYFPVLRLRVNPIGTCQKVMMTMTTLMAAYISHWPVTTTMTTLKPPPTPLMSTASKLGDCGSPEATLTTQSGLQDSPTRILPPTTAHAAVNLPIENNQRHLPAFHAVEDPADDDVFFTYLEQWCDHNDENFDSSLELDAIAEACKCMQRWPTATPVTPIILPTATNHSQQSLMTLPHWCDRNNEDDNHPSAINELSTECDHLQHRWPHATLTAACSVDGCTNPP